MTLTSLVIGIAIFALVLTTAEKFFGNKLIKNYPLSLLQNFVGGLFIFSGMVKAVDPLGTAFKMEQYFAEFESTFAGTKAAFLAPMFPTLAEYAIAFSVIMIVFEIVLGLALLLGSARKFTAWAFFLLVVFFTFLTGFTYLTGYVPEGVNFFQFGQWGPYEATNMKVTDCGCFGDFLKLEPKTSFLKDVVLLVPGLLFIIFAKQMHQVFSLSIRRIIMGVATVGLLVYCFSNYVWDIPHIDFRPFSEGANIAERKALEEEAEANVKVLAYRMTNKTSGEVVELPFDEYLAQYQDYPEEEWELEQIKSEPEVPRTKISDFEVSDLEGNDVTYEILSHEGTSLMIIAYKMYGTEQMSMQTVQDSVFTTDTLITENGPEVVRRFVRMDERQVESVAYSWDPSYVEHWTDAMAPLAEAAHQAGAKVYAITAYSEPARIDDFRKELGVSFPFYMADDILLKTIVRSNPGLVVLKNGLVVKKWHRSKLPDFEQFQQDYLQ